MAGSLDRLFADHDFHAGWKSKFQSLFMSFIKFVASQAYLSEVLVILLQKRNFDCCKKKFHWKLVSVEHMFGFHFITLLVFFSNYHSIPSYAPPKIK